MVVEDDEVAAGREVEPVVADAVEVVRAVAGRAGVTESSR
jgi:hypothetical protein